MAATHDGTGVVDKFVILDLETTGFINGPNYPDIVQIAASCGQELFNAYVLPEKRISAEASQINGLQVREGKLFLNELEVPSTSIETALEDFLQFLDNVSEGGRVNLVAHNGFRFDAPIIFLHMELNGFEERFNLIVNGFIDTLPTFKMVMLERKAAKKLFNLVQLKNDFLESGNESAMHNAVNDVKVLGDLIIKIGVTDNHLLQNCKTVQEIKNKIFEAVNRFSLRTLNNLSRDTITKLAKAGITLNCLYEAYCKDEDKKAIISLLSQDVGGKPLFTNKRKMIDKIIASVEDTLRR